MGFGWVLVVVMMSLVLKKLQTSNTLDGLWVLEQKNLLNASRIEMLEYICSAEEIVD